MKRAIAALTLLLAACSPSAHPASQHSHGAVASVKPVAEDSPFKGAWLNTPYKLPSGEFVDTSGKRVIWPQDGLPKPVTILFFGYTHCDDGFCQTQTADAAAAVRGLPADLKAKVAVVFITSDPARDNATVLRKFLDQYSSEIVGLTGEFASIQQAAAALGVEIQPAPSPAPAGGYEVAHGTQLIGFGPDGTAPVVWLPDTPIADIRADLQVLAAGGY